MSETRTTTLTEFLLARIAEDEAAVAEEATWTAGDYVDTDLIECDTYAYRYHISPARVLAECEAKRRIVEHCEVDHLTLSPGDEYVLRLLALPYADHPDCREEWKP